MSEMLRLRANELRDMLDETKEIGQKLIIEGFIDLIKESENGTREAKVFKNFTILDQGLGGINGTLNYQRFITRLAKIIAENGFCSFGNYKIDMGGGYMRTGDFFFSPRRTGVQIKIPIS